jgi:uncharacterized protein
MTATQTETQTHVTASASPVPTIQPGWYPDPWAVAPWRWWDGQQWSPILRGPYGEAWPLPAPPMPDRQPKGPGIQGGGIAAVGAGVGAVLSTVVGVIWILGAHGGTVDTNNPWFVLVSQLALWVGFVGAVVTATVRHGTKSLRRDFGLAVPTASDLGQGMAGGLLARLWPALLTVIVVWAGTGFSQPNSAAPRLLGVAPSGVAGWTVLALLTVVGAPLVEELFFRGLIQGAFSRRIGATPAIFVTALIFAGAHVTSEGLAAPFILFPLGLGLGYLRQRSGRLAAGMVAHATFNASLFLLFLVPAFR